MTFRVVCDDGEVYTDATVLNVSEGGAFLHTRKLLPVGSEITISPIGEAARYVFELTGKVVRHVQAVDGAVPGMGIQFQELDEDDLEGLRVFFEEMPATSPESLTDMPVERPEDNSQVSMAHMRMRVRMRR